MDKHEQAMAALRDKLAEARRHYEEGIVAINTQRVDYVRQYREWHEIAFPPERRGRSARHPDHLTELAKGLTKAADAVFRKRGEVRAWRVRISLLELAHTREEVSTCPACQEMAAIRRYEEDNDVSECCICQHTQVRRMFDLRFTPWWDTTEPAVKWERGPRTPTYYI